MSDQAALRTYAEQFLSMTDSLLELAKTHEWDDFLTLIDQREALLASLMQACGDDLLQQLPDLRERFALALARNEEITLLATRRRDELAEGMTSVSTQRRLNAVYRP